MTANVSIANGRRDDLEVIHGNSHEVYSEDFSHHHNHGENHEIIDLNMFVADGLPNEELLYDLADLFKVFSDTTRIKILFTLIDGDRNVSEIAELVGATQSAVSHQLRILKQARLVRFTRHGKNIHYSLADNHVFAVLAQGLSHVCE